MGKDHNLPSHAGWWEIVPVRLYCATEAILNGGEQVADSKPSDTLKVIIRKEEDRLLASLPVERRWGLLELVRAIDHYYVYILGLDEQARAEELQSDRWDLYRYGQSKAVSLFTDQSSTLPGPSLSRSTQIHQQWADAAIANCGRLGICEMLLNLNRYGLVELSMPSPEVIHATTNLREVGIEAIEADERRIFYDVATEMDQQIRDRYREVWPGIMALMLPLVEPWQEHYIQYETNSDIDDFFRIQGLLWVRAHYEPGQDSFPPHATFGGLPFALYKGVVAEVVGWVLKHVAFSNLLHSKHTELDLRNLLTVTTGESRLVSYLSAALDISGMEARQVLDTLKLTPENVKAHLSEPVVAIAPFLSINSTTVIFSVAGALSSPFDFMVAELDRRYRKDWDRAVNGREEHFRRELYDLFPTRRFVRIENPLKFKTDGNVTTDIDAAIFDTETGTLGLFQLKWQDPFGTSMRKRRSKMMNFLNEANRWVSTVNSYLLQHPKALDHLLAERAVGTHDAKRILLFVLGRHFSHFSGEPVRDSRAAWGMWPQVLRIFRESHTGSDPITWLHRILMEQPPSLQTPVTLESFEMEIGEYRVRYDPVSRHEAP